MRINSSKELAEFTIEQWRKSKIRKCEIAVKLGVKPPWITRALDIGTHESRGVDAIRVKILRVLGWEIETLFIARRIRK